jgi:hypothetical protein
MVHVVDDQQAMWAERGDCPIETVPFAALGVGEDEVELAGAVQHLERTSAVPQSLASYLGQLALPSGVFFHGGNGEVGAGQQGGRNPGGADAGTGAKLKDPGQYGEQPADGWVARH